VPGRSSTRDAGPVTRPNAYPSRARR